MVRIITVIGLNGSGKSTTGDIIAQLIRRRGYRVELRPLARPLKLLAHKFFKLDKTQNRFLLEEFAEQLRFLFGYDIFVNLVLENSSDLDFIIVPDMRYIEEYLLLQTNAEDISVIECAREVETTEDDRSRLARLIATGIPITKIIQCERSELVTRINEAVSDIVKKGSNN
ncbi:MAG: hypothetical protein PHT13_00345 [Methanosarcina sp.]|nr:hypothetical protein [Methanosarcina sp.]